MKTRALKRQNLATFLWFGRRLQRNSTPSALLALTNSYPVSSSGQVVPTNHFRIAQEQKGRRSLREQIVFAKFESVLLKQFLSYLGAKGHFSFTAAKKEKHLLR